MTLGACVFSVSPRESHCSSGNRSSCAHSSKSRPQVACRGTCGAVSVTDAFAQTGADPRGELIFKSTGQTAGGRVVFTFKPAEP